MKYCEQCKLTVTGQRSRCPLCQSVLRDEGEPYEEVFPVIPTVYNRFQFFFKLLIFASAVLGIVSVVINLLLPQSGVWSLFVLGGIGCLWVFLFIAVRKRNNIPKNILWQVAVAILFCLLWDLFTGWQDVYKRQASRGSTGWTWSSPTTSTWAGGSPTTSSPTSCATRSTPGAKS